MELISRERTIEAICSIESEVAKKMPYDKEWFDRMCDRQHEIIDIIKALPTIESRPKGKEEKLIEDIITVIRQEKYIYEHVHLYRAIKELVERYQEELGGEE